eukprot:scaffold327_cov257-Pinguiococcus_pyrenoidosus.AAC.33
MKHMGPPAWRLDDRCGSSMLRSHSRSEASLRRHSLFTSCCEACCMLFSPSCFYAICVLSVIRARRLRFEDAQTR